MNQGRIWTVVKPTVGLPLLIGSVAVTSLLVHYTILSHTTWYPSSGKLWPQEACRRRLINGHLGRSDDARLHGQSGGNASCAGRFFSTELTKRVRRRDARERFDGRSPPATPLSLFNGEAAMSDARDRAPHRRAEDPVEGAWRRRSSPGTGRMRLALRELRMNRLSQRMVNIWLGLGPRFLPFADAATPDLPLSRLLRLSLFQVSVGMALVLLIGT